MGFARTRLATILRRWAGVKMPPPPAGRGFTFPETGRKYQPSPANFFHEQWYAGQSAAGRIGDYAPSTIRRKIRRGLPHDRVVLYETGLMYERTAIRQLGRDLLVQVKVPYASYLQDRYGERIWGLGGQWREAFIRAYIAAIVAEYLRTLRYG